MTTLRPLVLVESPFSHPKSFGRTLHRAYLEACLSDCISRGEVPLATHKMYTDCLDDSTQKERKLGMSFARELSEIAHYVVVYYDLGISSGMLDGIIAARKRRKQIFCRSLYSHPLPSNLSILISEPV